MAGLAQRPAPSAHACWQNLQGAMWRRGQLGAKSELLTNYCVILAKLLHFSESQFTMCEMGLSYNSLP